MRADGLLLTEINLTADGPGILGADSLLRITARRLIDTNADSKHTHTRLLIVHSFTTTLLSLLFVVSLSP